MLTFFSTPKPFRGHIAVIQRNALESWRRLHPDVEVILFGDDEGTAEVCRELGLRHEPYVERSKHGTKKLDSIFGRAQEMARHGTLGYVNCDIVLTQEFVEALQRLLTWRSRFLMVGRRWDTDITKSLDFSSADWQQKIIVRARTEGYQRFYHNIDYFVFPRGLYTQIPDLVIGRVGWDHWLVEKAHTAGVAVVDVSGAVCAVHQNHDYGYHPQGMEGVWNDEEARRNLELAGGAGHTRTIEDAEFKLEPAGIVPNRFFWLAPAKRRWRDMSRAVRGALRTRIWHPLLDATRSIRHVVGLKRDSVPTSLRSRGRRHWMDE
jgi:hypothetical protein